MLRLREAGVAAYGVLVFLIVGKNLLSLRTAGGPEGVEVVVAPQQWRIQL